jgi:hypothetical protein
MLISLHPACGGLNRNRVLQKEKVSNLDVSVVRHLPPMESVEDVTVEDFSVEEFDFYCTLFEVLLEELEMRDRMEIEEWGSSELGVWPQAWDMDLEALLDEFDYAEIDGMRERFGLQPKLAAMPPRNVWKP